MKTRAGLSHIIIVMLSGLIMMTSSNGKYFPRYWSFVRGIHRSPVNSPNQGQWRGALMFSLISNWTNSWANNGDTGDLRRHRTHYDVIIMWCTGENKIKKSPKQTKDMYWVSHSETFRFQIRRFNIWTHWNFTLLVTMMISYMSRITASICLTLFLKCISIHCGKFLTIYL